MSQTLQVQLAADLARRAEALPQQIQTWQELTQANVQGMGIHRSQVAAINLMFEEFLKTQTILLQALDPAADAADFTRQRMDLEQHVSGSQGLMGIFRLIMAQRRESAFYQEVLDAADLIAADCYRHWMEQARTWGVVPESQFREPPLTYLNGLFSPAAYTREHAFATFKLPLENYAGQKLPISIISLPFHHAITLWAYCAIYHEVGHPLDQDLGITRQLLEPVSGALDTQAPGDSAAKAKRRAFWRQWLREAVADTVGVLQGGAAFAYALANILYLPIPDVTALNPADRHPAPYVRIFLLSQLLQQTGVPALAAVASDLEQLWQTTYGQPSDLQGYGADCPIVARVLLTTPLAGLQGHSLLDFGATLAADHERIARLARYLHIQFQQPDPKTYAYRLVPAAAQMAMRRVTDQHATMYAGIQERTLKFIQAMERPPYLADSSMPKAREAYLRGLAQALTWEGEDEATTP